MAQQITGDRLQNEGFQKTDHTVFVSYSHKDKQEKDALLTHLAILEHIGLIDLWSDDRIGAGADWEKEINRAIERSDVAILLVSANFLTSGFILRKEIPRLLERRQGEGLTIFPVIAKACAWKTVDWLTKMNVRPKNGIPVWSDKGSHVDEDLAAIAEEVAATIKKTGYDLKAQSQPVTSSIDTSTPSPHSHFESTPSQHIPIIENLKQLPLPTEAETILKAMFDNYRRVVIIEEFGAGFSGSRIFMVRPIIDKATAHLRTVVKLASVSLIEKEWQAYQDCIRYRLPDAAQIQGQPVLLPGCEWGGLRYALQGGGGTFEIESLYSYLHRADIKDVHFVLKRLFKRLEQILQQASPYFEFQLRTGYDRILPINLLIEPTSQPGTNPQLLTPNHLPDQSLKQGDRVQVSGFVITKVDPKYKSVTLNCPANHSPSSYCLRLKPIETVGTDRLGQIMDPIEGVVTETRREKLEFEIRRAMGEDFALTQETISWPGGPSLPNPLIKWPSLLQESRDVKVACIHGDLNLENILVDPETRDVSLIDFADARRDHVLHDFLRLETEIVTKIIPDILYQHNLPPETIYAFYRQLHTAITHPGRVTAPPNPVLEKPWAILLAIRETVGNYLWKSGNWTEYYQGLALYLLGALKFKNLDEMDEAPAPLSKQVAFWGAAVVGRIVENLFSTEELILFAPSPQKKLQRRIDAAAPGQAEVGQQIDLLVQVRFPNSPLLGIEDWPVEQKPSSIQQASEPVNLPFPIDPQTRKSGSTRLEIRIEAPSFTIIGKAQRLIEVLPDQESKLLSFLLTARKTGNCRINVEVYRVDGIYLGTIPLETKVGKMVTTPATVIANLFIVVTVEQGSQVVRTSYSVSPKDDIRELINLHSRRLQELKKQQAIYGISVDPKISIEIEDIEEKIKTLQIELKRLEDGIEDEITEEGEGKLVTPAYPAPPDSILEKSCLELSGSGAIAMERGIAAGRDIHLHITPLESTGKKESTQFPSEPLISRLKPVQQAVAQLLQSVQPKQSKPYFHHVEQVIKYLTHFVSLLPPDKQLSEPETLILIASAYLHDIGRYFPQPERTIVLKNRRTTMGESDPEQIPRLARRYYHELSWEWIKGSLTSGLYPSLGLTLTDPVSEIALVCLGHREVNLSDEKYRASGSGLQRIRPALLAALLSVADLLALISPKPDPKDLKQSTESPETQLSVWMRHYLDRVSIQSGHIRFHYQLPTEDYSLSVRILLSGSIQGRLRQVRNVLSENGVVIALDSSVAVGPSLEMPPEVLAYAKTLAQQRLTSVIATLGQPTKQGMPYQFTGLRGRPTLKWPDVTRAERYRCQLFDIEQHLLHQWETTTPEIILPIDQLEPGIQYEWITYAYRGRQRLKDRAGGIFWIIDDQTTRWIERQTAWYKSLESFTRELVLGRILTDYGVYEEATSIYQTVLAQGNAMEQLQARQELIGLYEDISRQLDRLGKRSRADGYLDAALVLANNLQAKL